MQCSSGGGAERQMGGVKQELRKPPQKESVVFISSSLALAALRPDGSSSLQPYTTEGGDMTPVRISALEPDPSQSL